MNIQSINCLILAGAMSLAGSFQTARAAPPTGYTWNTIISDDFNSLNTTIWGTGSTPWGTENQSACTLIPAADTYTSGGSLVLRSRLGPFTGATGTSFAYSSGWAWTRQRLTYGYLEIYAQYPNNLGAWPAFWMLGEGWPPEIDVAEYKGPTTGKMTTALCTPGSPDNIWNSTETAGTYTGWRTYGLDWQAGSLKFYVDGVLKKTITGSTVPSVPMYVILSNGTNCDLSNGTGFPNYYNVSYFRWYQHATGGLANGTYSLKNRTTGKMLDNLGSTTSGTDVGQWTDGTSDNQKWTVSTTGGYSKLMCVTGGKYLDSLGHTAENGTVGQLTSSASTSQQWLIQPIGNGYYYVVNRANGLYLDSTGSSSDGAISVFYRGLGNYNQQWQFVTP